MKKSILFYSAMVSLAIALSPVSAYSAGFQRAIVADPDGSPLEVGIWYPSQASEKSVTIDLATMSVGVDGQVEGRGLPLVLLSHGSGSSFMGHFDTAIALADAGYVVAAVTHTGDNHVDQKRSVYIMDRPRQISRVIDHMLTSWEGRAAINVERVGMFGFSSGGFTTLVSVGGRPDFSRIGPVCQQHPEDYACLLVAKSRRAGIAPPPASPIQDERIKAAVVVAPALGFTFSPAELKDVTVPIQLWRAEDDLILPHPRYAEEVRRSLPHMPDYRIVPKAGHFDFLPACDTELANVAPFICKSNPGFDRKQFHHAFNSAVLEFFDRTLRHKSI